MEEINVSRRIRTSSKCRILWEKGMPESLRDRAPKAFFDDKTGRVDVRFAGGADHKRWVVCSWPVNGPSTWRTFVERAFPWRARAGGIPSNG